MAATADRQIEHLLRRAGFGARPDELAAYGAQLGNEATIRMAEEANHFKPELHSFDRQGRRIDRVKRLIERMISRSSFMLPRELASIWTRAQRTTSVCTNSQVGRDCSSTATTMSTWDSSKSSIRSVP